MLNTSTDLPLAPVRTSPGFSARPPGMFSVIGTMPTTVMGAFSSAIARIAPIDGRAAGHVVLHPLHAFGGLDRDAAGVEGDALADQPEHRAAGRAWRRMAQHEHTGRLGAATGDAEQQAHAEPRNLLFVEDLDVKTRLAADGGAALGEHRWRQHIRRFVAQLARQVARFAEHPAAFHRRLERRIVPVPETTSACSSGGAPRSPLL